MKKIFIMIVAVIAMFSIEVYAQQAKCLLSHNGNVTLYDASDISKAITSAAVGDTIYLSEGSFPGFTISKNVSFIGGGETTIIDGNVTVNISGTTTFTNVLMDGTKVTGSFTISSSTNNLRIRSCKMKSFSVAGTANNLLVEKCFITDLFSSDPTYVKSATVLNSRIYRLYGSSYSTTTFVNCNLYAVSSSMSTSLLNCIIQTGTSNSGSAGGYAVTLAPGCYLTNCAYSSNIITSACVTKNCYAISSSVLNSNTLDATTSVNGYEGNDGTPVGSMGGASPYTLRPSAPTVTSASVTVDPTNQTLNVNIQVTAQ